MKRGSRLHCSGGWAIRKTSLARVTLKRKPPRKREELARISLQAHGLYLQQNLGGLGWTESHFVS